MGSTSHDESATLVCFLDPQLMAAWLYMKTKPEVECLTAQSLSEKPLTGDASAWYRRPRCLRAVEIAEHLEGGLVKLRRRMAHHSAQHAHGVRYIGACVRAVAA